MANEKKTKEELTEVIFRALRSEGGMDVGPFLDFEELLPEYEQEVKNILAEIILQNKDNQIVYQTMFFLISSFANNSATKSIFLSILGRIITWPNQTVAEIHQYTKEWVARIADMRDCKSIKLN